MAITNFAQEVFRSDSDQILMPRQKFNFTLVIQRYDRATIRFHRVASVTGASYTVDTVLMNQYNKKRVIQTRLNYEPVSVSFYDTFDNEWHTLMRDYLSHYFNGEEGIERRVSLEGTSVVDPGFTTDQGFTPNPARYFFPRISIVQNGYRNQFRETILINPIITNIQADTLDYSESAATMYNVTFQPESVQIRDEPNRFDDGI